MNKIRISIVICTYNRAALLEKCLDSLLRQQPPAAGGVEIIVVDNKSTDNTRTIVDRYRTGMPNLRYVYETNQGLSYARNRGCSEAAAEYLVYLDDDAMAPPDYLNNVRQVIEKHSPDIMGGPVYPYYTSPKPFWFRDEYETRKYESKSGFSKTCSISGGNYIIKKSLLVKMGMFDVSLGMKGDKMGLGEERLVLEHYRAVTSENEQKVYYALDCYINHYVPEYKMKFKYILMRYYQSGKDLIKAKNRGPEFFLWSLITLFIEIFSELKKGRLIHIDYVKIAAYKARRFGSIIEIVRVYGIGVVFIANIRFFTGSLLKLVTPSLRTGADGSRLADKIIYGGGSQVKK